MIENRRLWVDETSDGTWQDFSENFYISTVQRDLITGEQEVYVTIETARWGDSICCLPRDHLDNKVVSRLLKYGLTCPDTPDKSLTAAFILLTTEASAVHILKHSHVGFVKDNSGEMLFLLNNPVKASSIAKRRSVHTNPSKMEPHGNFFSWKKDILKTVIGSPNLELALTIGALAPIAHLLLEKKVITEVPLLALIGHSTSGKTTCLLLMSSIWFSREMIGDFNCTQNAFFEQMGQAKGLPALIDEASAVPSWDFTNAIYNLPKGRSKLRCTSTGKLIEPTKFSGAIIFTGEKSFLNQTTRTRGLEARLLELSLPWTRDKQQASDIEELCRKNYGVAGRFLILWLLENSHKLRHMYDERLKNIMVSVEGLNLDSVTKRLFSIVAMLMVTADVIDRALGIPISIKGIKETLVDVLKAKSEEYTSSDEYNFDVLKGVLMQSPYNFLSSNEKDSPCHFQKAVGFWGTYKHCPVLWVERTYFEELVTQHLTIDLQELKKRFADRGWMVKSKDRRYIFQRTLGKFDANCYGLVVASGSSGAVRKEKTKKPCNSKIEELLV